MTGGPGSDILEPGPDNVPAAALDGIFCDEDLPFMMARIHGYADDPTVIDQDNAIDRENREQEAQETRFIARTKKSKAVPNFDRLRYEIKPVYGPKKIAARVQQLSEQISRDYADRRQPLVVLGVLNGCSPFLTDLIRAISDRLPMEVDFVRASFYGNQTVPAAQAWHLENCHLPIEGKEILVVDDILDTGKTMNSVIERLYELQPYRINACVCVEKRRERRPRVPEIRYRGFTIHEGWVVGYGMDYHQYFRNLPYIGVIPPDKSDLFEASFS